MQRTTFDVSLRKKPKSIFRIRDHRQSESVRRKAHRIPEISKRLTPPRCWARIGQPCAPEALQRCAQRHRNANSTAGSLQLDTTNASDCDGLSQHGRIHFLHCMPINNIVILIYIKLDEAHLHGQYISSHMCSISAPFGPVNQQLPPAIVPTGSIRRTGIRARKRPFPVNCRLSGHTRLIYRLSPLCNPMTTPRPMRLARLRPCSL